MKKRRISTLFFFLLFLLAFSSFWIRPSVCAENEFQPILSSFVVSPTTVAPGDYLKCHFQFSNEGSLPCSVEENVFLHFTDTKNRSEIRWQADHQPPVSTRFWMTGQVIDDGPLPVAVPESIADGEYGVRVGLWNSNTNMRGLDEILPVTVTVKRSVAKNEPSPVESITYQEARRFVQNLMLTRFVAGSSIELNNRQLHFLVQPQKGLFCIREREIGVMFQSAPGSEGFGYVMAENDRKQIVRLPLNQLEVISRNGKRCALQKKFNDSAVLDIEIRLVGNEPEVEFAWKAGMGWTIHRVEWTSILWTTDALGGGAVIPRLIGELFPANDPTEFQQTFGTYAGWGGLHIPMAGMLRAKSGALVSWDTPYTSVTLRSLLARSDEWPGVKNTTLNLHSSEPSGSFRLTLCNGNSYVDVAKAYRPAASERGLLVTLDQKAKRNKEVKKLMGAAEFKPFVCIRFMRDENGETSERVVNSYTEADCVALAKHLHDDLQLEKVLFVLAGWIHRGYDNQHPDILPAAPEIGGDEGVALISEMVRSYGYLFGLHDNYQDMYGDAPSFDPSMIVMGRNGTRMKGGQWAGGQAWLISSDRGLELAHRNLPEVKKLFSPNAYFIDTTYAAPLYESFDPDGPLTRMDDLKFKRELSHYAAKQFSVHGSETGFAFGVPVSHYFEGILSGKSFIHDFPNPGAVDIPFFPLVFHDCVAMYTHQGDRAGIDDARMILQHLVLGEMPLYEIGSHQYWRRNDSEPDVTNFNYCFARCEGGWGEGKHPVDRFIKNTYEFMSPFAEGVASLQMTDHQYLKEDRSVEYSRFGEHWQVVVNYGPEDYQYGKTILPPMGFIALGPDFLAQHFYPNFGEDKTSLIVKHGEETFIGFK